jgi:hypothetical protein
MSDRPEASAQRIIPIQPIPAAAFEGGFVSLYAKQPRIYARSVQGLFNRWRWAAVFLTQAVFYGLAWLPWHGRQAVLFDLGARRFYLFD